MLRKLISALASICLAISFLAAGLGVCAGIPQVTLLLAEANSNYGISPYSQEVLVQLACETRDFTVLDYGRAASGDDEAALAFADKVSQITGAPYNALDDRRFLDEDAISHLNDVNRVLVAATWPLVCIAVLAAALTALVFARFGKRAGGNVLLAAGAAMLAIMAIIGAWAAFGFDAFFTAFHSLFFTEGTWTFPYDSLLICMYPIGFWTGMAAIWALTTAALSATSVVAGALLRRKAKDGKTGEASTLCANRS